MHTVGPGIWRENWKIWKMRNTEYRKWNILRNTQNRRKWEIHNVGPDEGEKTEKRGKWEKNTVGPEYGKKYWKTWKMRNAHCRTWNMLRKLKIMEIEKHTLLEVKYGEEQGKRGKWDMHTVGTWVWCENRNSWKIRNTHCRSWNMIRKLKNVENEKQTLYDLEYVGKHLKNVVKYKCTL